MTVLEGPCPTCIAHIPLICCWSKGVWEFVLSAENTSQTQIMTKIDQVRSDKFNVQSWGPGIRRFWATLESERSKTSQFHLRQFRGTSWHHTTCSQCHGLKARDARLPKTSSPNMQDVLSTYQNSMSLFHMFGPCKGNYLGIFCSCGQFCV